MIVAGHRLKLIVSALSIFLAIFLGYPNLTSAEAASLSPDGSIISGGSGSLTTSAGSWSFGGVYGSEYGSIYWSILLNGKFVGAGDILEVANGGKMYARGADSISWFLWNGSGWTHSPSPSGSTIDSGITLNSAGDINNRRAALINKIFQSATLPGTQAVVTTNVANPFPTFTNIARVDKYVAAMSNGQTNVSNFYTAGPVNNKRMVVLNPGHQFTCDWPAFHSGYRIQPVLQALLKSGFSVFAMNMPNCGDATAHDQLFQSYGDVAMRYFIEPLVQALNYMDNHYTFLSYDMAGLSGGGWTTTVAAAIDTRIKFSVPVSGSMPGVDFVPGASNGRFYGDAEQHYANYFALAGYLDHYVLDASGAGRQSVQVLDYYDDCCFGHAQWTYSGLNYQTYYGVDWLTYLSNYSNALASTQAKIGDMDYQLVVDNVADQHQISTYAQSLIISLFSR